MTDTGSAGSTGPGAMDPAATDSSSQGAASADPIALLRAGLRDGDPDAVALGLRQIPVGIAVDGGQPRVALDGERRLLPVFLDLDSWRAFGIEGDPQLLQPGQLAALLEALTHVDEVLVDPALPSAMRIPRVDVVQLLGGSTPASGTIGFDQDAQLARRARAALDAAGLGGSERAWAVQRRSAAGSTPAVAVADGVGDDVLASIADALGRADLPRDLELVQLDADWTRTARDAWAEAAVA